MTDSDHIFLGDGYYDNWISALGQPKFILIKYWQPNDHSFLSNNRDVAGTIISL